jgi:16S rRNA (cytosine967-C5)-methyltransferase
MPGPIRPGERVLDLCAAPGGKFLAIAESMPASGGELIAADRSLSRLRLLHANALRCGVSRFQSIVMDACRPAVRGRFERILLDAPCTGTGVIRRHPEIRWRRGPDDIDRLARRQAAALDAACGFLAPGGRLVYAVCSLEPEEGPEQIAAVLERRTDMALVDARTTLPAAAAPLVDDGGCLRTLPQRDDIDGFFAAVLTRK